MFNEDFSGFFNTNDFAIQVAINNGGEVVMLNGILDRDYIDDLDVSGVTPVFTYSKDDYSTPSVGMTLTYGSTVYEVKTIDDDLSGIIALRLMQI